MNAKLARETWAMIYRLIFEGVGQDRMQAACEYAGVAPGVIKTLIHLDPACGTPMRDLASHFGVDASYVTSLVDDLERAGLAERRQHPTDRRVKTVSLTAGGVEAQERVHDLMWEPPAAFEALAPAELRELHRLLAKVVAADEQLAGGPRVHHGPFGPPPRR
jgi:DNA-binding MarR family transcriptional regulator